jgi:hypothetical protein
MSRAPRVDLAVAAAYLVLSLAFTWPLPRHAGTALLGDPGGDTAAYVWNLWVFRHELVDNGQSPFYSSALFAPSPDRVGLVLHNYTVFADLLGIPLQGALGLGLVTAFNVAYWLLSAANAFSLYLLARYLTRDRRGAFLAGLAFGFSSFLVTRGTAHYSLAAAAALPAFLLLVLKARETRLYRYALGAGLALVWALFSDPYYAVFCVLIGAFVVLASVLAVTTDRRPPSPREDRVRWGVDGLLLATGGLILWLGTHGGGVVMIGARRLSVRGLYTPVLVFTALLVGRAVLWNRVRLGWRPDVDWRGGARLVLLALAAALVAGLPFLPAVADTVVGRHYVSPPVFWRSSPPGADLAAFLLPNPNSLWGSWGRDWLASRPNGYVENVASQSLVVLAIVAAAAVLVRGSLPRFWWAFTAFFTLLALGPFIRVAGVMTYVPTPWTLLRYLPVLSNARSPTRFVAVAGMGVAVLFAFALRGLWQRRPALGRLWPVVALALLVELSPVPRELHAARVPGFYQLIARDPRDVSVLELPVGVRSGASNVGDFNAFSLLCQTQHHKPLFGGYLSRVEDRWIDEYRRDPMMLALFTLSSGNELEPEAALAARADRRRFLRATRLGYVVIDNTRTTPRLQRFAVRTLRLVHLDGDGRYDLYQPSW